MAEQEDTMANNRIYLKCRGCGEVLYLGKRYAGAYWYSDYEGKDLKTKLNDFYDEHWDCRGSSFDNFEIAYEDEPDREAEVIKERAQKKAEIHEITKPNFMINALGIYDESEVVESATVVILHNSVTDEYSVGWFRNENPPPSIGEEDEDDTERDDI